jgi:hypothetical protein
MENTPIYLLFLDHIFLGLCVADVFTTCFIIRPNVRIQHPLISFLLGFPIATFSDKEGRSRYKSVNQHYERLLEDARRKITVQGCEILADVIRHFCLENIVECTGLI